MSDTRIPVYSEQEHYTDIEEPETIENDDISPHTKVVDLDNKQDIQEND